MKHENHLTLINELSDCAAVCSHCSIACLQEDDVKMLADCIRLDIDCADICRLTAGFLSRDSAHADRIVAECAEICNACAAECEKHEHMDHCKACAEACRKCAAACMEMVAA